MGDRFKLISNMNIEHKISNDDYKYTTKITSNFRDYYIDKISLNSKIKTKLFGNTLQFSNNITNKS